MYGNSGHCSGPKRRLSRTAPMCEDPARILAMVRYGAQQPTDVGMEDLGIGLVGMRKESNRFTSSLARLSAAG